MGGSYPGVRYGQQPDVGGLDPIEIIDRSAGADECHGGARDVTIVDLPHVDDTVRDDQVAERLADAAGTTMVSRDMGILRRRSERPSQRGGVAALNRA
ncbi:hypothetical protein [Burkholderia cenocepacia]|uniref:hypothetical protein n=1 Tax=Burkholderia cenocepacia TaxID=95486 RepID=UPI00163A5369|nr:hypothetical protein [Burkholderia cenocepacia]MBR8511659.1 hypothetical protein [Burkholderia cenocepacia]